MWQTRWRKVENHGLEWKPLATMILNGLMAHRYQSHFLHGKQENQTTLEWRIVPTCNNRYFSPPQRGMRKNYIVFKGLWWNWIPVLVRSFSPKSIKERVLFWLGGDSFAVFTNLVNNFKWGKRAKEVMNHVMFRYVMYDSFEGGGKFNFFFRNIRIIFIRQQKPSNFFLLCYTL